MAQSDILQSYSVNPGNWQTPTPGAASSSGEPPSWLAAAAVELRLIQRRLDVVGPIKALSFGGTLFFVTVLTFLLVHSPSGQSVLLVASLFGLPICLAAWLVARSVRKRLRRTQNSIRRRIYDVGMYVDDQGRVLTDNPHAVVILDPATVNTSNMS
jgi:hypothetical protein